MKTNQKVACTIAAILSACATTAYAADAASAPETPDADAGSAGISEVLVTAQRREESIQNVPITIQAITGQQLSQLNVSTFDDVIKFLPNVTFSTNGPGQGNIYMRGLSAGFAGSQSSASIAPFPNVALYLDDQSMQFPARNLDVYMVDMERVEVLEGPQGTLFGGGAEAGAVRYITNKPKLDAVSGDAEASYGVTAGGDPNSALHATLNVPVIPDVFALRGVIYNDRRGGYIDNVPSTFTRQNSDLGAFYTGLHPNAVTGLCPNGLPSASGNCIPAGSAVANNFQVARPDQNPVDYTGARLSGLYKINDDWDVLIAQSYQNMEADGVSTQYPIGSDGQVLGKDQVTSFTPAYYKDKFENTAWTVDGKIWDLKAVYTGGYLVRNIDQRNDYTNYARAAGGFYYSCTGGVGPADKSTGVLGYGTTPTCYSPVSSWHDKVRNTHQSHEFRLSTPTDWRARGIVGAFYEDFKIFDVMNFDYKTIPSCTPGNLANALAGGAPCVANVAPAPGSTATDTSERSDSTAFGEDLQRGYKQEAFFASAEYDLIPKVLTIAGGTRWYHYTEYETGSQYGTNSSCVDVPNGCTTDTHNIDAENLRSSYRGFRSRGNITWHVTDDAMLYYTFSQGFRPGGFNRTVSGVAKGPENTPQYEKPAGYAPDSLTNHEIGWKTEFFDHRLQVNGSLYYMNWDNVQVLFFDPVHLGNTTFGTNGPNYNIKGVELQLIGRVTQELTLMGSGSYNKSKQTNSPCLVGNIPGVAAYGQCISQVQVSGSGLQPFNNPFGAEGGSPAFSPQVQFNLRARYDMTVGQYNAYAMFGANYTGGMFNQTDTAVNGDTVTTPTTTLLRYYQPAYTTYDASIGVNRDNWSASLFGTNLSNSNASVFTSSAQFIKSEVPIRPRVLGVKVSYKF